MERKYHVSEERLFPLASVGNILTLKIAGNKIVWTA